mmetsp:Transcript_56607/g.132568  ORF Transcript_56607/g.132568 Transcript_56607/m.132568 type:complete len:205 (+) Transcript_56607:1750-2364(+)
MITAALLTAPATGMARSTPLLPTTTVFVSASATRARRMPRARVIRSGTPRPMTRPSLWEGARTRVLCAGADARTSRTTVDAAAGSAVMRIPAPAIRLATRRLRRTTSRTMALWLPAGAGAWHGSTIADVIAAAAIPLLPAPAMALTRRRLLLTTATTTRWQPAGASATPGNTIADAGAAVATPLLTAPAIRSGTRRRLPTPAQA